ncbi:YheT family hydrolase [Stratiformator vulcanicus]|uniref:Putative hydrolase n=1 Tax=Stratiformator vulcanicus TaxID=2527980 RepID=A0A517QVS7_9PLAN|nr:alpha/beta fold hydrolase [Stratiformator vulcanicus]QDT35756.1 putative hydrolase [Stratiformator vulcanicus]
MPRFIPIPPFRPPRLLRNPHTQTLIGAYGHRKRYRCGQDMHLVELHDGDRLVLHDDAPAGWEPGGPTALFLHGLLGCHISPYVARCAAKLKKLGFRTFRIDYRGTGAGRDFAERPYHAGLSEDIVAALSEIARLCPASPIALIGYSMGGNLALKTLGQHAEELPDVPIRGVAVNPAVDLAQCCFQLKNRTQRMYDRFFARGLTANVLSRPELFGDVFDEIASRPPKRIVEFDRRVTVPLWGFRSTKDYYRQASAISYIDRIKVPTLVLHSKDDPLIPWKIFESFTFNPQLQLHLSDHGGHMGYFAKSSESPDGWWADYRIIEWLKPLQESRIARPLSFPAVVPGPTAIRLPR